MFSRRNVNECHSCPLTVLWAAWPSRSYEVHKLFPAGGRTIKHTHQCKKKKKTALSSLQTARYLGHTRHGLDPPEEFCGQNQGRFLESPPSDSRSTPPHNGIPDGSPEVRLGCTGRGGSSAPPMEIHSAHQNPPANSSQCTLATRPHKNWKKLSSS